MAEQIIEIQNNEMRVAVSTLGATLKGVFAGGENFIWSGDKKYWGNTAPLLFPICGGVKNQKYSYAGREYTIGKHGFIRTEEFSVERHSKNSLTLSAVQNERTKEQYPFDFKFTVTYTLCDNVLCVDCTVENTGKGDMYFSLGAHDGYSCPGGIEKYKIVFDKPENLTATNLFGDILDTTTTTFDINAEEFPLKYSYFKVDAQVFKNLASRGLNLCENNGTRRVRIEYPDSKYLVLWTVPGAEYICIEPWCGIHDDINSCGDITKKEGIIKLAPAEKFVMPKKITFGK